MIFKYGCDHFSGKCSAGHRVIDGLRMLSAFVGPFDIRIKQREFCLSTATDQRYLYAEDLSWA